MAPTSNGPSQGDALLGQAEMLLCAGKAELALELARRALAAAPGDPRANRLAGLLLFERGETARALPHLEAAAGQIEDDAELAAALGVARKHSGDVPGAVRALEEAVRLAPQDDHARFNLGLARLAARDYAGAAELFAASADSSELAPDALACLSEAMRCCGDLRAALEAAADLCAAHPERAEGFFLAGLARLALGETRAAAADFSRAAQLEPENSAHHTRLGEALFALARYPDAAAAYKAAQKLRPDDADLANNLGAAMKAAGEFAAARETFEKVLARRPDHVESLVNLGLMHKESGETSQALAAFDRAARSAPKDLAVGLYRAVARIPMVYAREADIDEARAAYETDLRELDAKSAEASPRELARLARAVGNLQPYYLAYQGRCDKTLQRLYGRIATRAVRSTHPGLEPAPPSRLRGRIRVALVSGFFRSHSVYKMPLRGWLAGLDPGRFEVLGLHTAPPKDGCTAEAAALAEHFIHEPGGLEPVARKLAGFSPHAIVYPELGMDPVCARAACLRLAPVQCASWGHPETSGLATIDIFLSSERMEPEDGDDHYSEELVRLPGLGVDYEPPAVVPAPLSREDFGLAGPGPVCLCLQSVYKYLPRQDAVFARIAARTPGARFVFLKGPPRAARIFERRITAAFAAAGLDPEAHLVFLQRQSPERFAALCAAGDVFLDSFEWSGCNTTLETLAHGVPGVTLPGALMRGRHGAAILTGAGLDELVADSVRTFEDTAVRLCTGAGQNGELRSRVREGFFGLTQDGEAVARLGDVLEEAVRGRG